MANGDINVRIAAAGDMTQGRNEINPRFQANALRNARGLDCGVLANDFYNESADYLGITRGANSGGEPFAVGNNYSASQITIGAGMATAYGYDLQIEQNIALTTDENGGALSAATGYLFVYLEWDLTSSPAVGDIKIHNNGTAGVWRSIYTDNDNLIENPQGKYKLPLHRFYKSATGSIRYDGSWETLNLARTIERPQVAEVALYAETMEAGDDSDRIATTKYADAYADEAMQKIQSLIDEINDGLNFGNSTFTVAGVDVTIKRLGGYVIGTTYASASALAAWTEVAENGTAGTVPTGYRPQKTEYGLIYRYELYEEYQENNVGQLMDPYLSEYRWRNYRIQISTDGTITALNEITTGTETDRWFTNQGTNYTFYDSKYSPTDTAYFVIGYTTNDKLTLTITAFEKKPVTLSYDETKVYVSAPSYFEAGKSFEIRAEALTPAQEAVVSASVGSSTSTAHGNGTFTINSSSSATSATITITTQNIDIGGSAGSTTEA